MELQDISNKQPAPHLLKTFERRRKAAPCDDAPATPASADTPASHGSSTPSIAPPSSFPGNTKSRGSTALCHRGRRSSILHAVALPGGQQYREPPASRSLLLQQMSRAKRKAYLAYTKQMADYFAEVDEFELVEESPGLPTEKKTRPRAPNVANSSAEPFAHTFTPAGTAADTAAAAGQQAGASLSELSCKSAVSGHRRSSLAATPPSAADADSRQQVQSTLPGPQAADAMQQPQQLEVQEEEEVPEEDGWVLLADTPAAAAAVNGSAGSAATALQRAAEQLAPWPPVVLPSIEALAAKTPYSSLTDSMTASGWSSRSTRLAAEAAAATATAAAAADLDAADELDQLLASPATLLPNVSEQPAAGDARGSAAAAAVAGGAGVDEMMQQLGALQIEQLPDDKVQERQQQHPDASLVAATPLLQEQRDKAAPEGKATGQQGKAKQKQRQQKQEVQEEEQILQQQPEEQPMQQQVLEQQQEAAVELMAQQLAQEAAAEQLAQVEAAVALAMSLTPLQQMLQACGQPTNLQDIPSMKQFMADVADLQEVVKLGEGTYGEAFKAGPVVFKLVPIEGDNLVNGWPQKGAGDLLGEAVIASTLTGLSNECDAAGNPYFSHTKAFVQTHKVGVCRGPYPQAFIKAWKVWHKRNTSENDPIDGLPRDQLYACFAMANCGRDLEGHQLRDWDQARSMMLQVALALAVAEEALAFEHRDLHWGNVMLSPATSLYTSCRLTGCTIRARTEGAAICLIDFTASRLQTPAGDVAFCDLEQEEGLFDGPKGKCQFETYRRMRKITAGDWAGSYPSTNVQWMLYLAELLLTEKTVPGLSAANKRALREFKKRVVQYSRCGEVIWDSLFQGLWSVVSDS